MKHGLHEISRNGPIVIFRAKGAFNMDGVKDYEKEFVHLVTPLLGKPWGIVNLYPEFETGGPDVIHRIRSQYAWCIANGCQFIGFHSTNPLHEFFAKKTTEDLGWVDTAVLSSESAIMDWMQEKLTWTQLIESNFQV